MEANFSKNLTCCEIIRGEGAFMIELGRGRDVAYVVRFSRVIFASYH